MSRWYRAYEGTVTDPKLGEAALVAGTSKSVAIAAWHAILESAASVQDGGRFETTARRIAASLSEPLASIESTLSAFEEIGMTSGGVVSAWAKRQYESDKSATRTKQWRDRKKAAGDGDVTSHVPDVTPPETEAETEQKEIEDKPLSCAPAAEAKHTRLPKSYRLTEADRQFARDAGWSESEIEDGEAEFVGYWSNPSLPKSKALKLDWSAVWRGRVRDIGKRRGANHRKPANLTPIRGGYDESRSATAAAKRLLEESLRRDEEDRWGAPLLSIGSASGGDDPDGMLPQGRSGGSGHLRSVGR